MQEPWWRQGIILTGTATAADSKVRPRKDQAAGLEARGLRKEEEARTIGELHQGGADPQVMTQRLNLLPHQQARGLLMNNSPAQRPEAC